MTYTVPQPRAAVAKPRPTRRRRINRLTVVSALCFIGVILCMAWIAHRVVETDAKATAAQSATVERSAQVQALASDVDALRAQVQASGETPVAPAASETIQKVTTGPAGVAGQNGQDGAAGVQGDPGPAGPAGANGVDGADGTAVAVNGINGTNGKDGSPGKDGTNGTNGVDGRGIASVSCTGDGDDSRWVVTYTDGTSSTSDGPCRLDADSETSVN